jgi:monomeric sarcosine oxidase
MVRKMSHRAAQCDAVVVGGGVVGAATAWALARRGTGRVVLLERHRPGHTLGSSHGDGRIFRFTYAEAVYLQLARQAAQGWELLAGATGQTVIERTGNWDAGPAGCREIEELAATLEAHDLPFERLDAAASNRRFPQLALRAGSEALFQGDGGIARADRGVAALWRAAEAAGVEAVPDVAVSAVEEEAGFLLARAADGRSWIAPRLVLAAGAGSRPLAAKLGLDLPLTVTREQVAYFPQAPGAPDHRLGAMPTFIDYHTTEDERATGSFYGLPQIDVPGVKVGWHHKGLPLTDRQVAEPSRRPPLSAENLAAVSRFVERRLPHLEPRPLEVTGCLYTNTPDYHFLMDRHPDLPHLILGTGFSGHGFKFGPALGEALAALALDEEPAVDLSLFRLARLLGADLSARPRPGADR